MARGVVPGGRKPGPRPLGGCGFEPPEYLLQHLVAVDPAQPLQLAPSVLRNRAAAPEQGSEPGGRRPRVSVEPLSRHDRHLRRRRQFEHERRDSRPVEASGKHREHKLCLGLGCLAERGGKERKTQVPQPLKQVER